MKKLIPTCLFSPNLNVILNLFYLVVSLNHNAKI